MPLTIADLQRDRRTYTHETTQGDIRVTYRPNQMTPAREAEIARISDDLSDPDYDGESSLADRTEAGLRRVTSQFEEVIEAWDLIGPLTNPVTGEKLVEDGEPVPVRHEYLRHVPSFVLTGILNGVSKDATPNRKRKGSSRED